MIDDLIAEICVEILKTLFIPLFIVFVVLILICCVIKVVRKKKYQSSDYYKQTQTGYEAILDDTGKLGEYYTFDKLKTLQGYKKYLFNCYLPKADGTTTEIDVIFLHESGVYVLESKNYSGWIFGNEAQQRWTQTLPVGRNKSAKKNSFMNPIIQNEVHLKWLRNYLGDTKKIPIHSYIVFSERCELKNVTVTSTVHHVIKREQLLNAIQQNAKIVGNCLSVQDIDMLYEKLYPLTQVNKEQKQIHIENIRKKHVTMGQKEVEKNKYNRKCPRCGGELIIRTAKKGNRAGKQFWGCKNYPECKFIENIEDM